MPKLVWATAFCFAVVALAGILLSASAPALTPGAAFGPAAAASGGWAGLLPSRPAAAPRVLSVADAGRYREIFGLQARRDLAAADAVAARLDDRSLMGHVLAARYLGRGTKRASYAQLSDWLANYADHPDAAKIYRLARARRGPSKVLPKAPVPAVLGPYRASRDELAAMRRVPSARDATPAQRLSPRAAEPRPDRAARLLYLGKFAKAFTLAAARTRSRKAGAQSSWTAGLAAWRLGRMAAAATHFEAASRARAGDDWSRAAGAFWAARARLANRQPDRVNALLGLAAAYPRTFYGLLATRALGRAPDFNWRMPKLDAAATARLASLPAGRRALALAQVGRRDRAEAELAALARSANRPLMKSIMALAGHARMAEFLFRIGTRLRDDRGRPYDGALYPLPGWRPGEGYKIDRAVIFAIMRQESQFQPDALSPAGARGLMQIMPLTASYVAGDRSLRRGRKARLFEPRFNVSLAQKYIGELLAHDGVRGDLFRLAAAYNGGIGNISRWRARADGDPLLFIESITFRETRDYVERILANIWMYRLRLGQATPSLDALAAGGWPRYRRLETAAAGGDG